MKLGEIVKNYREENKLSMRDFAKKSGLSSGYISMLEKNRNPRNGKPIIPSIETYDCVANALGISLDELLRRTSGQKISMKPDSTASASDTIDIKDLIENDTFLFDGNNYNLNKSDKEMLINIMKTILQGKEIK